MTSFYGAAHVTDAILEVRALLEGLVPGEGDLLAEIAGVAPRQVGDVVEIVQRQAPGTWLPLKVRRGDTTLELIARFPPRAP